MVFRNAAQDETETLVHTGRCNMRRIKVIQHTFDAPILYLQLFNSVDITLGTTAPTMVIPIPAGVVGQPNRLVLELETAFGGLHFATGLVLAVTTTHDGSTGPTSGDEPELIIDYQG